MKKLIIALSLLIAGGFVASAQDEIFNNPDNHPYFGVRASLDFTCPGDWNYAGMSMNLLDNGTGFSVGAIYNVPVYKNLYFEPGVTVYKHNAKIKTAWLKALEYASDEQFDKISLGEWGFEIPLMVGYHFDFNPFKISVFTGPEFRVGLSGKVHYKTELKGITMKGSKSMYGDDGGFNRSDVQWRFGVGFTYDRYYLSVSGAAGLCNWVNNSVTKLLQTDDIFSNDKVSIHRNTVSITLGYNF